MTLPSCEPPPTRWGFSHSEVKKIDELLFYLEGKNASPFDPGGSRADVVGTRYNTPRNTDTQPTEDDE